MSESPVLEATEVTAPVTEDVAGEVEVVDPFEEKMTELNAKLAEAMKAQKQTQRAVDQLKKAGIDSGPAFDAINATVTEAQNKVTSIQTTIENEQKKHQLQKIAQPLVDAIGEVEVGTGSLPATLNIGDIKTRRDKAQERVDAAQAEIKFLDHVTAALATVEIDQSSWDNMKPLNIIRIPDTTKVKVAIATRSGRSAGSGDGRASSRDQVTITKANPEFAHLIGKKIYGDGAEFNNWANLLATVAPDIEQERQDKIAKGSNSSAKIVAGRKLGIEAE